MERSDEALIGAHRQGDLTAFDELIRRYADSLFGYLMKLCGNRQQAEDVFQETFIRVHHKANSFRGQGRFKSWLFSIASNVAIDELRKRQRAPQTVSLNTSNDCDGADCLELSVVDIAEKPNDPSQAAVLAEQKAQVWQAIEQLPTRQRATVVLAYYQGLSYRQVAEVLGCSLGTVKSQMYRALKTLAGLLPDIQGDIE